MTGTRKRYSAAFKARVALEAAKQTRTLAELSKSFQVHPVQISPWKKQLLDGAESLFGDGRRRERDQSEALQAELHQQIGRLNMEVEWLKKLGWQNSLDKRLFKSLKVCLRVVAEAAAMYPHFLTLLQPGAQLGVPIAAAQKATLCRPVCWT